MPADKNLLMHQIVRNVPPENTFDVLEIVESISPEFPNVSRQIVERIVSEEVMRTHRRKPVQRR